MKTPENGEVGVDRKLKICCAPSWFKFGTTGPETKERNSAHIMDGKGETVQVTFAGGGYFSLEKSREQGGEM
jgi:hypothetical protein